MSLMERKDVIVVASVSCIYGLGIPEEYREAHLLIKKGEIMVRDQLLKKLVEIHYGRNDVAFERGTFRVKGDVVDIYPAYMEHSIRIEFFGDEIEKISRLNPLDNRVLEIVDEYPIYPVKLASAPLRKKENWLKRKGLNREPISIWKCLRNWVTVQGLKIILDTLQARNRGTLLTAC